MNKNDYVHLLKEACGGKCNAEYNPCAYRQAADSLAALKPVAWRVGGINFYTQDVAKAQSHTKKQQLFSLYALDEVTK